MAAIPYLWYWIVGGCVAALIATVTIFSVDTSIGKNISEIVKRNTGGLLLIDYGYTEKKMKNTLQAISNHKFANILENIGNVDITHNISFDLFKRFTKKMGGLANNLTTQKEFLLKMGIIIIIRIILGC